MPTPFHVPEPSLPPHRKVQVDLGPRAYDVLIGRGLLNRVGELMSLCGLQKKAALITDSKIETISKTWSGLYAENWDFASLPPVVPGEQSKSLKVATDLLSNLAKLQLSRSDTIIALGGGVIGDLAGFVAATYLRGINFVQVPTTLLAMVDSSVGGKTGVNLPEGKNLVGAFHQPKLVVVDLDTLKTLPSREFSAGMAEVIKYGAIRDKALFDRVCTGVKPEDQDLEVIIETCVAIKAHIVEHDEFETKGERALLNFGHTIGHAIEKATGYNTYLHGEAISLGMRAAAWLSVWKSGLPESDAIRIETALTANGLPLHLKPDIDRAAILAALGNDKKVAVDGKNRWVLLKKLGAARSDWELPAEVVEKAVDMLFQSY